MSAGLQAKRRQKKSSNIRPGILKRATLSVVIMIVAAGVIGFFVVNSLQVPGWVGGLIILLLWLLAIPFTASVIAGAKNRSPARWFFLTILFGGIPFLFILFLPTVEPPAQGLTAEESRELLAALRERKKSG